VLSQTWPYGAPKSGTADNAPVHRFTRILSVTLITAGLVVLSDAGLTLVWQEPISAAYATLKEKFEKRGDHWIAKAQSPG